MIRLAESGDVAALPGIERAAGAAFAELGMHLVAEDDPLPEPELHGYVTAGRAWVAGDPVCAYLLLDEVDGCAHVEQVSVHPDAARRGLGRALIERAEHWARAAGLPALTLCTFTEVPWNGPYYRRLGFRYLAEPTPGLRRLRAAEAAHGLDAWPRACMRRDLADTAQADCAQADCAEPSS